MATSSSCARDPATDDPRNVIPELGRWMYSLGWAAGTAGSISMRSKGKIHVSPCAVMRENIQENELRVVVHDGGAGEEVDDPPKKANPSQNGGVPSSIANTPLYMCLYQIDGVGAHIHSHSPKAVMATILFPGKDFRISNLQSIAGIRKCRTWSKYEFDETLIVPIIENASEDHYLCGDLQQAIADYPDTCAVLIRRHGLYVWGRTWVEVKCMAECYEYVFDIAIEMKKCGLDPAAPH